MRESGSRMDRIVRCPGSQALPHVRRPPTGDAKLGTAKHEIAAAGGPDSETLTAEQRELAEGLPADLVPEGVRHEVAYAWDWAADTARLIGYDLGRDYGKLGPTEIALTVDSVGFYDDGAGAYIEELKTGWGWIPSVRKHWQGQIALVAVSRAHPSVAYGRVAIARPGTTDEMRFDAANFDGDDIERSAKKLHDTMRQVVDLRAAAEQGQVPDVSMGPWCEYCPAIYTCGGHGGVLARLADPDVAIGKLCSELSHNGGFARAHSFLTEAARVLKVLKEARDAYVRSEGPQDLGNGRCVAEVEHSKETVKVKETIGVLARRYSEAVGLSAVKTKVTASKAGILAAIKDHVPKGKGAATMREVMAELREKGGATTAYYRKVEEVEAK